MAKPDDQIALRFLLGYDSSDFRQRQYKNLIDAAGQKGASVLELLNQMVSKSVRVSGVSTLLTVYETIVVDLIQLKSDIIEEPIEGVAKYFIGDNDLTDFYEFDQSYRKAVEEVGSNELNDSGENFDEWYSEVFKKLVENLTQPEIPEEIDHVRIMSLHSSKGLSAKFVILCSMIDILMPFVPPNLDGAERQGIIEEQRRLFYVAITRCKASADFEGRLIISSFLSMFGLDAVRMGIPANSKKNLKTVSTRFIRDFGLTSPQPVRGDDL